MPHVDSNLPRSLFGWYSQRLGLEMPIVEYGYAGHPLLIFPTAQADYLENERFEGGARQRPGVLPQVPAEFFRQL